MKIEDFKTTVLGILDDEIDIFRKASNNEEQIVSLESDSSRKIAASHRQYSYDFAVLILEKIQNEIGGIDI